MNASSESMKATKEDDSNTLITVRNEEKNTKIPPKKTEH